MQVKYINNIKEMYQGVKRLYHELEEVHENGVVDQPLKLYNMYKELGYDINFDFIETEDYLLDVEDIHLEHFGIHLNLLKKLTKLQEGTNYEPRGIVGYLMLEEVFQRQLTVSKEYEEVCNYYLTEIVEELTKPAITDVGVLRNILHTAVEGQSRLTA